MVQPDVERRFIMDGISPLGSVGAVVSQAQTQVQLLTRTSKGTEASVQDISQNALQLLQSTLVASAAVLHDLDLTA